MGEFAPPASAASHPTDSTAAFDRPAFLARIAGDVALAEAMAALFVSEAPRMMADCTRAMDTGNLAALAQAAHSLRGAANNFSALHVVSVAGRVEAMALQGDVDGASAELRALAGALDRLTHALQEFTR